MVYPGRSNELWHTLVLNKSDIRGSAACNVGRFAEIKRDRVFASPAHVREEGGRLVRARGKERRQRKRDGERGAEEK